MRFLHGLFYHGVEVVEPVQTKESTSKVVIVNANTSWMKNRTCLLNISVVRAMENFLSSVHSYTYYIF